MYIPHVVSPFIGRRTFGKPTLLTAIPSSSCDLLAATQGVWAITRVCTVGLRGSLSAQTVEG